MADHREPRPPDPDPTGERFGTALGAPAVDLAAALADLDRATRSFAERFGARSDADPTATAGPAAPPATLLDAAGDAFETRMREAEREAGEYLEHAKRRADSLVNAMVGAVEREAAEMRREAETGIRARWQAVEVDAARQLEEARRVADRLVAERQQRIAALSDGIAGRAQALSAGMDDAERVRAQFEKFVRSLSLAADRIASAGEPAGAASGDRHDGPDRPSAIAA